MKKPQYPMLSYRDIPFFIYPRKEAGGVIYYRFVHEEKNYHKSTKETSSKDAIPRVHEAIDKVLDPKPLQEAQEALQATLVSKLVAEYLETKRKAVKPSTMNQIRHFFKWFLAEYENEQISAIKGTQFQAWMNKLQERVEPSSSYWRDIIVQYNRFWKWCIQMELRGSNPLEGYARPKASSYNVYEGIVEDREYEALMDILNKKDALAVKCFRFMGIYPMDYAYAEKQDFAMVDGVLTFHRKRSKNDQKFLQPLDGRLEPEIIAIWKSKKRPTERMFTTLTEETYRSWYYCLQKRLYKAWEMTGMGEPKKIGAFRHTYLTEAIERGVPEDVVLQWGGYSKGSTIMRRVYLHRKSTAQYRYVDSSSTPSKLYGT